MTDEIVEYCRNNHLRTPENTVWERGSNGRMRRRCRDCRRESRLRSLNSGDAVIAPNAFPPIRTPDMLNSGERNITQRFGRALEISVTPCQGNPEEFTDYGEDFQDIPSPKLARAMCQGCKLSELCSASAKIMREGWGVWGGEVYVMGEVFYAGTKQ